MNIIFKKSLCILLICLFVLCYSLMANSFSQKTIERINFNGPKSKSNSVWQEAEKYEFPWTSPEYLVGWQKIIEDTLKTGIYISLFPAKHSVEPNEYENSLSSILARDYNARLISKRNISISGYQGTEMIFKGENGNGLDFTEKGNIPTTSIYIKIKLEKEPDPSEMWPLPIVFFSSPSKYFNQIKPEFDSFLSQLGIAPISGKFPPSIINTISLANDVVRVDFDKKLEKSCAENANNYSINSLGILKATIDDDKSVLLKTTSQTDTTYKIVVRNIQDLEGNIMKSPQEMEFTGTTKDLVIPISKEQYNISFGVFGQKSYYQNCFGPLIEFDYKKTIGINLGYSINNFDSSKVGYELKNNLLNIGLDYTFIRKDVEKDNGFNIGISGSYGFAQYDVTDTTVANAGRICVCFDADYIYKVDEKWSIKPYLKMGYVKYTAEDETDTDNYSFEDVDGIYDSFGLSLSYKISNNNSLFFRLNQYTDFQPSQDFDDSYKFNSITIGDNIKF